MTNTYLKVVNNIEKKCTSRPVDYNANSLTRNNFLDEVASMEFGHTSVRNMFTNLNDFNMPNQHLPFIFILDT